MSNQPKLDPIGFVVDIGFLLYGMLKCGAGERRKIHYVLTGTNLTNSIGNYPILKESKKIPTGHQYTFSLPAGISLKEFIERKVYFETYLGGQVEIFPPSGPHLIMQVHHIEYPSQINFEFNPPSEFIAPLPLGKTSDGEIQYIDLSELPHMLVGGTSGFGKTSLLKSWLVSLKLSGNEVFVIDRKQVDFPPLSKFVNVAVSENEALSMVYALTSEMERRQKLLSEQGVYKIQELKESIPYIVLIVDEIASIETKVTYQGIDSLTRLGRATGISVIMATQKASAKLWDNNFSNTRDMAAGRLSFYTPDYMMSQTILGKGNTSASRLPMTKGRAVSIIGDRDRVIQTMYLEPQLAIDLLRNAQVKPYFNYIETVQEKPKSKRGRPKKEVN